MNENEKRMLAETLAERYTSAFGMRNPDWDWEKPDGPDNEYHFKQPMDERVVQPPFEVFVAGDGCNAIRHPTITEIVEELDEAIEVMIRSREQGRSA